MAMDLGPPWKRRRPATACNQCRRRKIRCDGIAPCGPCSKTPGRRCEYAENPFYESRPDHQHEQPQQNAFAELSGSGQGLKSLTSAYSQGQDIVLFGLSSTEAQFADHGVVEGNLGSYFPIHDIPMITGPPLPYPASAHDMSMETPELSNAASVSSGRSTHARSTPSRGGPSPTFTSVSASSPLALSCEPHELDHKIEHHLGADKGFWLRNLAKCEKLQFLAHGIDGRDALGPGQQRLHSIISRFSAMENQLSESDNMRISHSGGSVAVAARDILPPRSICDVLVDAYMNTFETVLRILHAPSFFREYHNMWRRPMNSQSIETDDPLACKLVIILALGSTVVVNVSGTSAPPSPSAAEDRAYLQKQSLIWSSYGRQWLTRRMLTAQRTDLSIAQVMCLLALVRHVHPEETSSTAMLVHPGEYDLARIGMQMGLHRDPLIIAPGMPAREAEMRRRLWATMVELSIQRSLDEGLPAPLSPESYDCQPPSDVTDEELENESGTALRKAALEDLTPTTMLVLFSRTQRLRLRCLHLANSPGASKSYDDSHALAAELSAACSANTEILRAMPTKPSDFQLQVRQTYTWQLVRSLHEPFAEKASKQPSFHYSRKVRMEASVRVLEYPPSRVLAATAEAEVQTDPRAVVDGRLDECMSLRMHGQGYLWRVQRQAAISLCLDLLDELEDGTFRASDGASWRRMHSIVRDTVSVYERRVKVSRGQYGKRELVFLLSSEAYIGALLLGFKSGDTSDAISRAAEKALMVCCEVMDRGSR